jgi:hypothetical protein
MITMSENTGVYNQQPSAGSNDLLVTATSENMVIEVNKGRAWVNGHLYENAAGDENPTFTISPADNSFARIDRVVLKYTAEDQSIIAEIKEGEPSLAPIPPGLTRDAATYELCLAEIRVAAAVVRITPYDITDTRGDSDLCGFAVLAMDNTDIDISLPLSVESGGTGATTAEGARINLGIGAGDEEEEDLLESISTTLSDNTWAQIAAASKAKAAKDYWSVGDEKDITLSTGEVLTLQIYGFDHDDLVEGGKAGITFGMKHLMAEKQAMNARGTNEGGFPASRLYGRLNGVYDSLPKDLRGVIKMVNKKSLIVSHPAYTSSSKTDYMRHMSINAMKLFIFSREEVVYGSSEYALEGTLYPGFTSSMRKKYLANGTGAANVWWLRSVWSYSLTSSGHNYYFYFVDEYGDAMTYSSNQSNGYASNQHGVCFGFCV